MRLKTWLLAGTGLGMLAATATPAFAQEALVTAYMNYIVAEQSGDTVAIDSAKAILTEECIVAGYATFDDCVAFLALNPMGAPQTPAEPPAAEQPVEQPPAEQPPAEQPPAPEVQSPPVDTPAAVDPMVELQNNLNLELGNYQQALDLAAAGDFANAQPLADASAARILELCNAAGYPSIEACIGQSLPALPQPPVPEQPAPPVAEEPAPEQPAPEQPAPEQPAPEQPAPPTQDQPPVAAQLQASVQLYAQGIAQLQAGDSTGQQAIDMAMAQMQQTCGVTVIGDVIVCLQQYGLTLPEAQAATPVIDSPVVSDTPAPPTPPPPSEPIPESQLDQQVTTDAVEPLPADVLPEEAAPLLDSIKDIFTGGGEIAPPGPAVASPPAPTSDADSQSQIAPPAELLPFTEEQGPQIAAPPALVIQPGDQPGIQVTPQDNGTGFVLQFNTQLFFDNPEQERDRIWDETEDEIFYEELSRGRIKETIVRPNGVQIVTIRNRDGDVLRRSRIMPDGREYVLAYYDEDEDGQFTEYTDPGDDLPPLVLNIPARDYLLDATDADEVEVADFLSQPPVEQVRRLYSIEEVKRSARIRDSVRRLEIGGLTFDSGKATISRSQVGALANLANAMLDLLDRNPAETFLIEGHTDAVGSDISNLALSDLRAATIARILTDFYGIPPENLVTQGYGERYLKVRTEAAERLNRRVTARRITPLITLASN